MTSQKQITSEGSTAVQATGDVTIHQGITVQQMSEILNAVASHITIFRNEALQLAERVWLSSRRK
jgi:hypothetical protein